MAAFRRITQLFPKGERLPGEKHLQRGETALNGGDFSLAVQEIEHAIALGLSPDRLPEAYSFLGGARFQLNQIDQAITAYSKSVELDPQRRKDWNNLGVACWRAGRFDQAIDAHQQALRIDPKDANAYSNLGTVYLSECQPRQAIEALEKAIQLNPDLAVAHSNLALAYAFDSRFENSYASISNAVSAGYSDACMLKFKIDMMKTLYALRGEGPKRNWLDLLEEAKADPDNADMTSLRYAYALSDEYDPYLEKQKIADLIQETRESAESGDWQRTLETGMRALAMNYMVLKTHEDIVRAYLETGQKERAIPHQQFLRSCLRSVHQSGYGQSYQAAYVVISLDEEYMFVRFFGATEGFQYQGQRRYAEYGDHAFDVFVIHDLKTGRKGEVFFNIDLIRKGVADGRDKQPLEDRMGEIVRF